LEALVPSEGASEVPFGRVEGVDSEVEEPLMVPEVEGR